METTDQHPGYGPWEPPAVPPDFFLRHPGIRSSLPRYWKRPRQCLIDDSDAISYSICRAMLVKKWNAHDEEIALWVKDKRLHVFASHHEIYFDAWGRRIWRHKPTDGASTRPCVAVGTIEDPDTPCKDWLTGFLFSRSEAEGFSPADSSDATMTAVDYVPYSDAAPTGWINPSGRYLTYQQAIHFLGRFESDAEVIAAVVRREFDRGALVGQHPFVGWTNCPGLPKERIDAEDSLYMEGQIVGLAVKELAADISRWDAATAANNIVTGEPATDTTPTGAPKGTKAEKRTWQSEAADTEETAAPQQSSKQESGSGDSAHKEAPTGQSEAGDEEDTAVPQQSSEQESASGDSAHVDALASADSNDPKETACRKTRQQISDETIARYQAWEREMAEIAKEPNILESNRRNRSYLANKLAKRKLNDYKEASAHERDPYYKEYGDHEQRLAETIRRGHNGVERIVSRGRKTTLLRQQ